jgi:hypothetical protein
VIKNKFKIQCLLQIFEINGYNYQSLSVRYCSLTWIFKLGGYNYQSLMLDILHLRKYSNSMAITIDFNKKCDNCSGRQKSTRNFK